MTCSFLKDAWRATCGLPPSQPKPLLSIAQLRVTEWSNEFEQLMRNRLIMGAFRYGLFKDQKVYCQWDVIQDCVRRLKEYQATGNDELLVDVANMCMKEFVCGDHPLKHFAAGDDGVHVPVKGKL